MRAVNLIPSERRAGGRGLGHSHGAALVALGLMAGIAVLALLYGVAHHQISSRRSELAARQAQIAAEQARTDQLTQYTNFIAMSSGRVQAVSALVQSRFDWAHALHELGRVLPTDVSLTSLHGTVGPQGGSSGGGGSAGGGSSPAAAAAGSAGTSATPPGTVPSFTLSGCTTSQSEVARTLQRLRLIDGVSDVQLQSSTKQNTTGGSSSSGGAAGCPANGATFTLQLTFLPLPSTSASPSTQRTASASGSAAATPSSPSTSSGAARATGSATYPSGQGVPR